MISKVSFNKVNFQNEIFDHSVHSNVLCFLFPTYLQFLSKQGIKKKAQELYDEQFKSNEEKE